MSRKMTKAVRKAGYLALSLAFLQLLTVVYTLIVSDSQGLALIWHVIVDTVETFAYIIMVGALTAFIFYSA